MGTPGHLGDFNLQKFFPPSSLSPYTSPSASYSAGFQQQASASHPLPYNTFPSTYPFNSQQPPQPGMQTPGMQVPGMYHPYIHYPQDHGHRPPPYPTNPYPNAPSFTSQGPPPGTFTQPPFSSSASASPPFIQPPSSTPPSSGPQSQANVQSSAPATSVASLVQAPEPAASPPLDGAHLMALLTTQSSAETSKEDSSTLLAGTPNLLDLPSSVISSDASQNNGPEVSLPPPAIAPALPTAPPINLAPPNSRLPGTKPSPRGRYLNGYHVVYDIDERRPYEAQPQLEVSPITVYGSDPVLVLGRQIAVNRTYIGYGLKQGHIRILNINTALRVLLRGHTQRVTDMVFFSEDVHLLASASTDGRIFVRRVLEGSSDDTRVAIKDQIVLAIQLVGDWKSVHPRVCWHSENQDVLLVGIGKYVLSIDAAKARVNAPPGGFSAEDPIKCPINRPLEGVHVFGEHSNDVTDLSVSLRMPTCVASASLDGTVRIWGDKGAPPVTLYPHQGQAVNSVSFISAPSRPDHAVLVTAGPLNREVKLWTQFPLDAPLGKPGSDKWKCIQILELKSSKSEGRPDTAFFNQVMVVPNSSLVILANAKKNAIYVVHLEFGLTPSATQMDYLAEFSVTIPILSLTATCEGASDGDGTVQVYCVQTQAIQQYALELSQCLPTSEDTSHARSFLESQMTRKADEQAYFPVDSDYPTSMNELTSVSSTASIVTASTVVNPTGPSRNSTLGIPSERASTYEQDIISSKTAVSLESTATVHTSEADVLESIDALSSLSSLTRYSESPSAPPHNVRPVSPAQVPSFLNNKRQPQGESPNHVEDGYVLVPTGSGVAPEQPESTSVQGQQALESVMAEMGGLSADQTSSRGGDFDKEEEPLLGVHSLASDATNTQQQPSTAASYLLSPTELMNLVARSKVSEGGVIAAPSLSSAEVDSNKVQAVTEVATSSPEPDVLRTDIPGTDTEVPQSSSLDEKDEGGFDEKTSLLLDVKDKVLVSTGLDYSSKEFSWDGSSSGTNFVESSPVDEIHRAEDGDGLDERELLPSSTAEDIVEHVKEVGSRTGDAASVSAAPTQSATVTKGRKNKNKTSVSPAVASLPLQAPSQLPLSTGTSTFEGEGSTSANVPPVDLGVGSQIATLQESVNQLVAMQKEMQKQMTATVTATATAPLTKEVKRVEGSLGSRMEKMLKANHDAMWARIQEEVAKREKQDRERTQQFTTLIGNSTKDIPATLERVFKKEIAAMGPIIARLVTPSVEKISTTAITDAFQKGVVEKVIPQLDKTVASKLETVVTRQIQAQLQQSLKPALQEAVRTAVEATMIPGFERSVQAMFEQVDGTLQRGIAEHTLSANQQFDASHSKLAATLQDTMVSASSLATILKGELTEGQRRLIALAETANVNRRTNPTSVKQSNSGLPDQALTLQHLEESLDPTKELSRLVNERNMEEAFTKALSISDVAIVSWLCTQVDLKSLFSTTPLPLSQGVLLSMIQQLGSDLGRDISLKLEWIKETALALNPKDPILAPHMRPFLEQLYQNLHRQSHHLVAGGELANSMRLVIHLVNSLLTACK